VYSISNICEIVKGHFIQQQNEGSIEHLLFDSRNITRADSSLFIALHGPHNDGHQYIDECYAKGVRNFIIDNPLPIISFVECNIIMVADTGIALHQLAQYHRQQFSIPVLGITGSNGKTIVKEWLYQLLNPEFNIVRSPKSYNSQLGVPLSVWQMNATHTLAIFEAGISKKDEMQTLQKIIQPTIGIITNIGEAHSEGFTDITEKLSEKLSLFTDSEIVIGSKDILHFIPKDKVFSWSKNENATVRILAVEQKTHHTLIHYIFGDQESTLTIPFIDEASVENCITCLCVLLHLDYTHEIINERFAQLHAVDMRLQLKYGINGCTIINDSYSADLTSFTIALHFLAQQHTTSKRTVFLSDFDESGKKDEDLYGAIAKALVEHRIDKVIAVGEKINEQLTIFLQPDIEILFYPNVDEYLKTFNPFSFQNETILIKGARRFGFERLVQLFETKVHQTILEINLNAIAHNLKQYKALLQPQTKIMAMVKAFSYGSGSSEIANILEFNNVNYLGVAYVDEGIVLRRVGIDLPIMVMNADESAFLSLTKWNLQPVIYSPKLFNQFLQFLKGQGFMQYPVHIEVETGMNRLGFTLKEINVIAEKLCEGNYKVESIFSHLAASEDPTQDSFTTEQAAKFMEAVNLLSQYIHYPFLKHIANSAAILRHSHLQMDMVRLGIGLYGVESENENLDLQPVATLRSTIAQLKLLRPGDTVSYNRQGVMNEDALIATVRIGYADGYSRHLGNGIGKMSVHGQLAPVVGTVCMDMTMIDVTGIANVREGDEVIVMGKEVPVKQLAEWAHTIPYEMMTSISQRVKRVYYHE